MNKFYLFGMIFFLVFSPAVYAQSEMTEDPVQEAAQPETVMAEEPADEVPEIVPKEDSDRVSLDFHEADIQNVLRILSLKSGVNIVAGPEVTGLVTIKLNDVTWPKALDVILETYGYAYDRRDNIISVTTVENLKKRRDEAMLLSEQEPLMTRTFLLNYAKAAKVIESVEKMVSERGRVNYDERTNALIVHDTQSNIEQIAEVIDNLDQTTPQVMIEARIIETTLGDTEKLGIDWSLEVSANGAVWDTTWPFRKDAANTNSFLPGNTSSDTSYVTYGTLDFNSVSAVLQALESRSNTNTLSNPRIVTLDNQPARIVVGRQYPFPTYTYNEEQATMQVSGWEYKDIGVVFEVTPHVNSTGMVTLELTPKVTAIVDDAGVKVEGTRVPELTTREASTTVMIENGQTLVIGGLISDNDNESNSKVPFLGDIPLLGKLFQHSSHTKTKTDLLIFLTPHIITSEKSAQAEVVDLAGE